MNRKLIALLIIASLLFIPLAAMAEIPAIPKVKLVVLPSLSGDSPLFITYNENSGDNTITNYSYDFGNGDVQYGKEGNYTYGLGGIYNLTLTVSDAEGDTNQASVIITVKSASEYSNENTTYQTVIEGNDEITQALIGKTPYEKSVILSDKTDKELKPVKFPFTYKIKDSEIAFDNYCCKLDEGICGYWIQAYRIVGGQRVPVYANSPIWISPPPFEVTISESYTLATNTLTTTIKEDLRGAITSVIQRHVDNQPLGTPITRVYECAE